MRKSGLWIGRKGKIMSKEFGIYQLGILVREIPKNEGFRDGDRVILEHRETLLVYGPYVATFEQIAGKRQLILTPWNMDQRLIPEGSTLDVRVYRVFREVPATGAHAPPGVIREFHKHNSSIIHLGEKDVRQDDKPVNGFKSDHDGDNGGD